MSSDTANVRASHKIAVLRYAGGELYLSPGRYVIGRAPTSDIVLADPRVSRQHARLSVEEESVSVEDLGSGNGVSVNGTRVRLAQTLKAGDCIGVGDEELEFCYFGAAPELALNLLNEKRMVNLRNDSEDPGGSTHRGDGLELFGSLAERALANQRPHEAAEILQPRLAAVLRDAKRGQAVPFRRREAAIDYACRLAIATHDGKWVDYALELLIHQALPCPEAQANLLLAAAETAATFDRALLKRYAEVLRAMPQNVKRIRAIQHADALTRAGQSRS
jgi:hypothetical protein